ncbi:molybdopterin-dependent oxidoreductase [Amnibacterium kyonggiense]|uniref:DMSO/TMAO reductase YedYZ molybdopterin-dependent catalytic subunit n=1 Tax=Amnibacterium kyonggiense TaxID=595671 RepID=A0A4R7FT22_9MICO|nr:molybdopterin-dependent oxidoreductase [Amnibacterium kyonggiense]TDS81031.1 DMSO/TMAO reductase YedYZ molybdopterin-dependent catalytic subunit [Amnibacterium kyonggiense]
MTEPAPSLERPVAAPPAGRRSSALAAIAGVASAAAALGAGELVAAVFNASASPILSVGSFVIDLTPAFLKSAVIAAFGTGDKPFLIVVLLVLVLAVGALAGLLQARRRPFGVVLVALLGVVAAGAAVTRTGATAVDAAPSVVAAVIGAAMLVRLIGRSTTTGRRAFLRGAVVTTAVGIAAGVAARALSAGQRGTQRAIAAVRLPTPTATAAPPAAADSFDVPGLTPLVTPNADFYRIDIALSPPAIDPAAWRLEVTGEVENPFTLTYRQLSALPMHESPTTLMCVSNEVGGTLNGTAVWLGTSIRDLLARARPKAGADMVLSSGADGFSASTPLSVLQDEGRDSLLAVGMNGDPLPQLHGFPVRMVVPGLYGYVSATKWLTRLEVTRFDAKAAYWTTRGYSAQAPVKISSRIDRPRNGARAGMVTVAGVAWAQHTGIARVQLQVDDGPWRDCELAGDWSVDVWRQWRYRWQAERGTHTLRVRATDADGLVQTAKVQGEIPNGATGLHTVQVAIT